MRSKVLPILLPVSAYARLEHLARIEERDTLQQARWLLKRALDNRTTELESTDHPALGLMTAAAEGRGT